MSSVTVVKQTQPVLPSRSIQVLVSLASGAALFILFVVVMAMAFNLSYSGRIYPGVSVGAVDLTGLEPGAAALRLASRVSYPQTGKIVLQYGDQIWAATPAELGLTMDIQSSAQAAYRWGRSGNLIGRLFAPLVAWYRGASVSAVMIYDEHAAQTYLSKVAAQVDRPTQEASLSVQGVEVRAVPGQVGRRVDQVAMLQALEGQMRSLTDGVLPLVTLETPPEIMDASAQAEEARRLLSAPLTLTIPDAKEGEPGAWVIPPEQLGKMLVIDRVQSEEGRRFQVSLDDQALYDYLTGISGSVNRQPANARFIFNDETRLLEVIQPAVVGRSLDVFTTIQQINKSLAQGEHTVALTLVYNQPTVGDNVTGEELGIREQIIAYTTYFRGSTAERLQNIEKAAANFHGLLVPPGATFSMAAVMGDVTLDNGYAEAWIIFGGRTIKGVGGGVCQVSTTLFRAVFFAGYPIIERHPHAYRVGYYEQTATGYDDRLAGLDATVFVPMVDFKFVNDTPYWLLMETYFNANRRSLTWKIYSTSDGRTVKYETTGPQNVVDPPDPVYEENPELPRGVIKQVDWAAEGADVTVLRTVYRDGVALFTDSFITHYLPWADVYQYGPGTDLPTKKKKPPIILNPF